MKDKIKLQKDFFDIQDNQYSPDFILNSPFHTKLEVNVLLDRLKHIKGKLIMDFGAGNGRISIPLLQKGFSVYSIDVSKKSLFNLAKLAKHLKLNNLKLDNHIPSDLKFNAIVGADILHHVDLDEYLPILCNSLKNGGKIIFSEPGAFNLSWYIYLPIASSWNIERGTLNCNYFNLKHKLQKYKYNNINIYGLGILPRPFLNFSKKLCKLNDLLGNFPILKLFAYRYIIEATK